MLKSGMAAGPRETRTTWAEKSVSDFLSLPLVSEFVFLSPQTVDGTQREVADCLVSYGEPGLLISQKCQENPNARTPEKTEVWVRSTGGQLLQANTLQDSLHPILKKLHHEKGGFNIFRRFRITYLNNSDCPEKLQHFWSGHAQTHVSERYLKLMKDREYRLEWAEQLGTGFTLPSQVGILGIPVLVRRRA